MKKHTKKWQVANIFNQNNAAVNFGATSVTGEEEDSEAGENENENEVEGED